MKRGMVLAAVVVVVLAACSKADRGPSVEQVAKGYEQYLNANLVAELGQRVEVRGWDDLNVDCNQSGPERTTCVTGGTLDVIGFQGGRQLKESPAPVPARADLVFEKRAGQWVFIDAQKKP
ncbi:TPA: hypothetical protein UON56_000452 [Stenotrophomonas maltophilia]|uniref:hypothetical protein n=1 Tax=Stenotrophomonas maltophilia TaxID=40324 RepID=UPI0008103626|nr:hypothetical protein [Stenotrophomonas maltophilia]EKU9962730.1 hypothetical protein [Stenotrophomonas maltophilia]MBH1412613.1 hypothetical protein [Stenotrophomonas maltophilia]MBH1421949.1 hypothetical protein [Stenotrophomonas maltophilia]MBN5111801.1 hypothetical protein [Stenotrophomonas maltophilia]OCK48052.1 hypothetical protein BA766_21350 [Stenotrophomonas maltophilia]